MIQYKYPKVQGGTIMERKRLKILNLIDTYFPVVGGISTVVDRSSIALSKYADVTVGTVKAKNYTDPERPYKILRCKGYNNAITSDGLAYPGLDKKFRKEVEEGGYDIIHCHSPANLMNYAFKVGKKLNIPVVATVHSIFKPDVKHYVRSEHIANLITSHFMKKTNKADYVWAVTGYCRDYVRPYGVTKDVTVMNNAIEFVAPSNTEELEERINKLHNISKDTFVMTFVSRMVKVKNVDLIIDAMNLLKDKNLDLKIFLVGDGDYFKKTQAKVKKLGLENYIIMTGMVKDRDLLAAYYARANLVLFPSYMDSAGLIQVEAAAYSKPTLVIENMAPAEKMTDMVNGLIAKNEPQSYANKMLWAYENKEKLVEIGKQAYKTLYRVYSDKAVTDEILETYYRIIDDYKQKHKTEKGA